MKKVFIMILIILPLLIASCGSHDVAETASNKETTDSVKTDSLLAYMQRLDSINNYRGKLRHVNVYKLGKMKSIDFEVYSIESKNDTVEYINLRKDCGGEYYYDWEDATLIAEEVKYFVEAIDTVLTNMDRMVRNEERYAYITNDDIRLFSLNENKNGKWEVQLSVDYRKKNAHISLSKEDLGTLKNLLLAGEKKVNELRRR